MTSIRAGERPNHVHHQAAADPGEIILQGLCDALCLIAQGLVLAAALERSRRPFLPLPRARLRPQHRPGRHRWRAIFPALPRPPGSPGGCIPSVSTAAGQVTA
jgi:hypothetical protein